MYDMSAHASPVCDPGTPSSSSIEMPMTTAPLVKWMPDTSDGS